VFGGCVTNTSGNFASELNVQRQIIQSAWWLVPLLINVYFF
jgi:hypothetical protein